MPETLPFTATFAIQACLFVAATCPVEGACRANGFYPLRGTERATLGWALPTDTGALPVGRAHRTVVARRRLAQVRQVANRRKSAISDHLEGRCPNCGGTSLALGVSNKPAPVQDRETELPPTNPVMNECRNSESVIDPGVGRATTSGTPRVAACDEGRARQTDGRTSCLGRRAA